MNDLFIRRGVPEHIRSDNGASSLRREREWIQRNDVQRIISSRTVRRRYVGTFNGKLRDELLKREIFDTRWEATMRVELWREYNTVHSHSSLGYRPPAPEAVMLGLFATLRSGPPLGQEQSFAAPDKPEWTAASLPSFAVRSGLLVFIMTCPTACLLITLKRL